MLEDFAYNGSNNTYTYNGYLGYSILQPGEFGVVELGPNETATLRTASGDTTFGQLYNQSPNNDYNYLYFRLPAGMSVSEIERIDVSKAERIFQSLKSNLVLRNLVFEHGSMKYINAGVHLKGAYNNDPDGPTVYTIENALLENVDIREMGCIGIQVNDTKYVTLKNVNALNNGSSGFALNYLVDVILENCSSKGNNTLGVLADFGVDGEAAYFVSAIKVYADTMDVISFEATDNFCRGFWVDVYGANLNFTNCDFSRNTGDGLDFELVTGPVTVDSCLIEDNYEGIVILSSKDITITNSTIRNNEVFQIGFKQGAKETNPRRYNNMFERENSSDVEISLGEVALYDNTISTNRGASSRLIYKIDGCWPVPWKTFIYAKYTGDRNIFYNPDNTDVFDIVDYGWTDHSFGDLAAWRAKTTGESDSNYPNRTQQDANSVWMDPTPSSGNLKFEAEDYDNSFTTSGDTLIVWSHPDASNGQWVAYHADAVADYMEFEQYIPAGQYDLVLGYRQFNNNARVRVRIGDTIIPTWIDQYAAVGQFVESEVEPITITESATYTIRLENVGKNPVSLGDRINFDFLKFRSNALTYEAENTYQNETDPVTIVDISGDRYVNLLADAVGDSIEFLLPSVPEGRYNLIVSVRQYTNCPRVQCKVEGGNLGNWFDLYSDGQRFIQVPIGEVVMVDPGDLTVSLHASGKNPSSSNYRMVVDSIILEQL